MRTILMIVLGLFIAQNVKSQNDSLIIKLEDYGQMIIVSSNLATTAQKSIGFNELYQKFYADFKSIDKSVFGDNSYLLSYTEAKWDDQKNRTISINLIDNLPDVFYFQEGKQVASHSGKYDLKLNSEGSIRIYLDSLQDFEKLSLLNLDTLYQQALNHFQEQNLSKRNLYTILYLSNNNEIDKKSAYVYSKKSLDYLQLYCSMGALMISSTFAPEFNLNLELDFSGKSKFEQSFGLSSTFLFMPDKNDFFNINTYNFLNITYQLKLKHVWSYKIGLGYMLSSKGDDFGKNTWNAYWQTNMNKVGIKLGGFYTKNTDGKYVVLPSIGFVFGL